MSKSTPSLLALLGLVAVAGYQNRDKLGDMFGGERAPQAPGSLDRAPDGGLAASFGRFFDQGQPGAGLSTGLSDLVERFRIAGRGDAAQSWISRDANMPLNIDELETVLGQDTLQDLSHKTGLSRAELLLRLNVALPEMVDRFTPDGHLPTETEAQARA